MSDSQSSSSAELGSAVAADESVGRTRRSSDSSQIIASPPSRRWRDVFWLAIFLIHLLGFSLILGVLGLNRFEKPDRLNIGNVGNVPSDGDARFTEDYWPLYAVAGGTGTLLGWTWLLFLGSQANHMMKVSVHILTTYLAVISVLCFWDFHLPCWCFRRLSRWYGICLKLQE